MLDREQNDVFTEQTEVPYEHVAIAATGAIKLRTNQRPIRVERCEYDNVTGFVQDPANFWTIQLLFGATVVASWSTQTGAQGTIAADTFVTMTLNATDALRVALASSLAPVVISLGFVKTGAPANLPLGRIVAHCKYV